jgi:Ras family protein T1
MAWGPDVYNTVALSPHGYIGLQGYLALWTLTTLLDTQKTLEHLAYLGYTYHSGEDAQDNALAISRERKIDLAKKQTNRNVYRCHVIGPRDAGKSTFCQGLLGRSLQDIEGVRPEDLPRHTINTIQVYGQEKYLVLQDIDVKSLTDVLSPTELTCDVACLVYDISNPRSFEFVARIFLVSHTQLGQ